ncbi:ectoine hydroxylase-related dioxygenase (phytanoyl-CoA dioxygenase family) [Litorivivens lipolytica]|uniref:Ectoine hydroxylase-related dioxygenase (Phytanoyl-CoA dioxygenase family) n=1 Tax=Litorivivens lipolytica TaxID=1524264 RepID=A0A7W4W553_9GAMM|nr:phytanoyl-CoA dioxygenase family protein [Litorivivens lipolytica]MBB3047037.1 ectoine hydroxylase-related dioxygenase (phytanoyl-CoA dioxygenase family) [Litorivivens lipolytica]
MSDAIQQLQSLHHSLSQKASERLPLLAAQPALPPLTLRCADDCAFSFRYDGQQLTITPATDNNGISIDAKDWLGLSDDMEAVPPLIYGDRLRSAPGELNTLLAWEPALRAIYRGLPVYDPLAPDLIDEAGHEHDPARTYGLNDSPTTRRRALNTLGYLVVHDVFNDEEQERFRHYAQQLKAAAREDDKHSWWGKNSQGDSVLCRTLNGGDIDELAGLYQDSRITQLAALMPEGLKGANPREQDGVTVIYKNPDMSEGLSDLPWHRDCGMGGHAIMCPTVIISIYLYDATDEAGALRFLPGSHKASFGFLDAGDRNAPRGVRADARAGSVTLHYGDVMHAAPEPQGHCEHYRQSILLTYQPEYRHHRGDRHYNDILFNEREDGQVPNMKDLVDGN